MSSGLSSKDEARATSIKADIGTVVQAIPAWYAGQQEVSIVNAIQLDTNLWKQNGDKAEYIYCDDLKTSGVNCKGGKITLKIVLLTPDESNNANAGNIALTKDAVNEINGVVKSNAIGKNKPWLVVDVEPKGSGIVHKLSRDFGVKDVSIALAAKKIVWH
jgi:hypothetical protein